MQVDFVVSPTLGRMMQSDARLRIATGPFGSGKSSGCMVEIQRRCGGQKKGTDGYRRSRWAIVRNTVPQLRDTTIKTWLSWFPDGSCGYWRETGKTFHLEYGDVRAEILFRGLDDASDVKNLLSLDLTGAYLNECREIAREIAEALKGRIGRFPRVVDGGCSWYGIIADTNMPEEGSYWWCMLEGYDPDDISTRTPSGWQVFKQPPAMVEQPDPGSRTGYRFVKNPAAENLAYLPENYYEDLCKDNSYEFIKVYVLCRYGTSKQGKPVHPLFREERHVARDVLIPNPNRVLVLAADFGLTPAIALKQQDPFGRVLTLDEIVTEGMGLKRAITERLKPLLRQKYDGYSIFVTGDPSGNTPSQTDESTCVQIFHNAGFKRVRLAYSNNPIYRIGATDEFLGRDTEQGPSYLISPQCAYLKAGMKGGYHYKKTKSGVVVEEPEKNIYSHICEAGQYGDMFFQSGSDTTAAEGYRKRQEALSRVKSRAGVYTRRPR